MIIQSTRSPLKSLLSRSMKGDEALCSPASGPASPLRRAVALLRVRLRASSAAPSAAPLVPQVPGRTPSS